MILYYWEANYGKRLGNKQKYFFKKIGFGQLMSQIRKPKWDTIITTGGTQDHDKQIDKL